MVSQAAPHAPVLRLTVLWRGVVVDSFAISAGQGTTQELRGGGSLKAEWDADSQCVVLTLDGRPATLPLERVRG